MPESQLDRRAESRQLRSSQPQWQGLFVAPAFPEGYDEAVEQEEAEEQPAPVQRRVRGNRRPQGRSA
ncbi:hypothetical protein G3I40_15810 [Streptomyces sp. SID14478]|uniref:hypothetical protein n=1 Tax=Streptomyces sp. SID14478 TaxID=2706073 RepID=UPI0013D90A33|nr:hypothetical protein [Streptomyces sp. SID14478]NEB76676.1 hypothetical protein [Streptomyces sp. SID14478]